jgi:hypothetical protein
MNSRGFKIFIVVFLSFHCLQGQDIRVPYRKGDKWGLADSSGAITVKPQFDSISFPISYSTDFFTFFSFKNGKVGLLGNDSFLIKPEYQVIKRYNSFLRAGKDSSGLFIWQLYSKKGELLLTDWFYEINPERIIIGAPSSLNFYKLTRTDQKFQLISYNEKSGIFRKIGSPFITCNVEMANYSTSFLHFYGEQKLQEQLEVSYISNTRRLWIEKAKKGKLDLSEEDIRTKKGKGETISVEFDDYDLIMPEPDRRPIKTKQIVSFGFNKQGKLTQNMSFNFNEGNATLLTRYSFKEKNVNILPYKGARGELLGALIADSDTSSTFVKNYAVYKKRGLIGIINQNGATLAIYTSVRGFRNYYDQGRTYYKVSSLGKGSTKYGLLNDSLEPIAEQVYQVIDPIFSRRLIGFQTQQDDGRNILNLQGVQLLPKNVDSIASQGHSNYMLKKDDAYGYFCFCQSSYHPSLIMPIYPYKIKHFTEIASKSFAMLYDDNNRFMGFAGLDGKLFFED